MELNGFLVAMVRLIALVLATASAALWAGLWPGVWWLPTLMGGFTYAGTVYALRGVLELWPVSR